MYKKIFLTILLIGSTQQTNPIYQRAAKILPEMIGFGALVFIAEKCLGKTTETLLQRFRCHPNNAFPPQKIKKN